VRRTGVMFDHELEQRCHEFAKSVRRFCRKLKLDIANFEDVKQLVRASGSIGANYIEANENLGERDLRFRIKVARKEAKECMHFLGLVEIFNNVDLENERRELVSEANQLRKILSSILNKITNNNK
jgi:four helix bundle protein